MKQRVLILILLLVAAASLTVAASAVRQKSSEGAEPVVAGPQWEYLVVGGSKANLTPSGNPHLRKEPDAPFRNEAFVVEQNMDKLGAKGWELVAVTGPSSDPIFYFKRPKQ